MIRAFFWIAIAYFAGTIAFSLATLFDQGLGVDAVSAVIDSVAAGLAWPIIFYDLVTGQTGV